MDLHIGIKTRFPKAPSPKIGMNNLFLISDSACSFIGLHGIVSRKTIFFRCYKGQEISLFQYILFKTNSGEEVHCCAVCGQQGRTRKT
jgi:hypothetical protein